VTDALISIHRKSLDYGSRSPHVATGAEGTTVSFTTLAAPKNARKAYRKAGEELARKNPNYAKITEELEKAVQFHPDYAEAWSLLGRTRLALNQQPRAREAFEHALAADPKHTDPYLPLAVMELLDGQVEEAAQLADRVLRLNPYLTEAHLYRAVAYYNLGKTEIAKESLREVLESGEDHLYPRTHAVLKDFLADRIRRQLTQWDALDLIK
jgi:tetratricopeptide (TPR) repeat protein